MMISLIKRFILILIFLSVTQLYCQSNKSSVYYGLDKEKKVLENDTIVFNLFANNSGHFFDHEESQTPKLSDFLSFVKLNDDYFFKILIFFNDGARDFNKNYSKALSNSLTSYLNENIDKNSIRFSVLSGTDESSRSRIEVYIMNREEN